MISIKSQLTKNALLVFGSIFIVQALFIGILWIYIEQIAWRVDRQREATKVIRAVCATEMQSLLSMHLVYRHFINAIHHGRHQWDKLQSEKDWTELPKSMKTLEKLIGDGPAREEVRQLHGYVYGNIPAISKGLISLRDRASDLMQIEREWDGLFEHADKIVVMYEQLEQDAGESLSELSLVALGAVLVVGLGTNIAIALALYNKFFSDITRRFDKIFEDINTIGSGAPLLEVPRGSDEIDMLAMELHEIAANIQRFQSNEKVMFDHATSVVCSIDESGKIYSIGRGSADQLGFGTADLIEKQFASLPFFDSSSNIEAELNRLFSDGIDIEFDTTLRKPSGQTIDISWKGRRSDEGDTAVLVGHDVTELSSQIRKIRQRQEEFKNIVDRMPIAVVTTDESFVISSLNKATTDLFRCDPTKLLARDLGVLITGATTTGAQLKEIARIAEANPIELNVKSFANEIIPAEFSMRSYANAYSKKTYLATFRDISARLQIENVKRDFVAMISHDLRSPLTALFGTLEIMVEGANFSSTEEGSALRNANTIVANLVNLINDFLDLEKFEAGLGVLELNQISLLRLVEATIAVEHLNKASITITPAAFDPNVNVRVDQERMTFALAHFVSLVQRFASPDAKIRIWLAEEAPAASITITAEGFHLPEEVRDASLSRYALVPVISDEAVESSGLALALSRAIINAHNGKVRIEADENIESVTIELPLSSKT
ncbi:HAMP domain-containing histidine kinase [Candidatus Obscuribacterales bacterium]|nr:HAMP domain-containing histidine kinase [Candidatus Obscuribacterales bacterium]MBX3152632.1 HAMP domain-containing histidine kinase [Candidatus Obscuribacterales bacterium]